MATKDQLPFGGGGTTAAQSPDGGKGGSGAHDFTEEPSSSTGTGPGDLLESRPQSAGKDDTINKESVIEGGKLPFPETAFKDAGVRGCGSIDGGGGNKTPFKGLK